MQAKHVVIECSEICTYLQAATHLLLLQPQICKVCLVRDLLGAHRDFLAVRRDSCELVELRTTQGVSPFQCTFDHVHANAEFYVVCTLLLSCSGGASMFTWTLNFIFCHLICTATVFSVVTIALQSFPRTAVCRRHSFVLA